MFDSNIRVTELFSDEITLKLKSFCERSRVCVRSRDKTRKLAGRRR